MTFQLGDFQADHDTLIIAEIGLNHDGDVKKAKRLVSEAVDAGADVVKFQAFTAHGLLSKNVVAPPHFGSQDGFFRYLESLELSAEDYREIKTHCDSLGVPMCATPLDDENLDLMVALDLPLLKVASCDLTHIPLLRRIASTGLPTILSTGMGSMEEVEAAVKVFKDAGHDALALLHCVSQYPPEPKEINLRAIQTLANTGVPVGYSDHSLGTHIPLAAVAAGATILEKHFTLDKESPGADHAVSMEPADLSRLVTQVREVEQALGSGDKAPSPREEEMKVAFRRSIVARTDLPAGTELLADHLDYKRPGNGITPARIDEVIGKRLTNAKSFDDMILPADLAA